MKSGMKKKKISKGFFQSVLIVLFSLLALFLILAIYQKTEEYRKLSYSVDAKFETTDVVNLDNKLPISDELGKKYMGSGMEKGIAEYKEFVISNGNEKKITYEIYLTKISKKNKSIRSNYIKVYLTDENDSPIKGFEGNSIKSYYDLYTLKDKPGSKLLYRDTLEKGDSKKFVLRSWVADTYVISNKEEVFDYDIDVRIK